MVYLSKRIDNDTRDLISFAVISISDFCTNSALLCMSVMLLSSIGLKWLMIFMIFLAVHALVYFMLKKRIFHFSIAVRENESRWQTASAAYTRINEIINLRIEPNGSQILSHINLIEVRNVDYDFGGNKIISGMTQVFRKGKIYCLTGKNGSGKSTLINLICGLLHPVKGQIKYNGININEIDMISARRKLISAVEQKDFLKNDNLSGGERRKLSISNALSKSSDVLIMDEPDNNLDAANISELIGEILKGKRNRITIIISHDKRIINTADELIDFSSLSRRLS